MYELMDAAIAEEFDVPVEEYIEKIESVSDMRMLAIIFGALDERPEKREQAKRVFNLIK